MDIMIVKLLLLSLAYVSGQYRYKCPAIGHHLLPHETDCSKFYYCEYGVRRNDARQCPARTLFSYEKQICDHAHNVKCNTGPTHPCTEEPVCDCSNQPILPNGCPCDHSIQLLLRHESDCGKFYQCHKGKRVLRECASGTHFNAKLQMCDHPSKAGCDPSCVTTTTTTTTTEKPACDCSNQPILPNGCPCDHSIQLLLRHESDCEKFYQCDKGERVLRECAPGTHFNAKLQVCDHPSKAGCDPSCVTTTTTTTTTEKPACDCSNQPILPNGCPCDHSIHLLLRHESDCEKFYQCDKGERVLRECAPGTHFNAKLQVCDHPSKAGCDPSCVTTTTTTTTTEKPACDCSNQPILPNGCPCDHSIHLLLRHESDCEKFYQCDKGERVLRQCAPGTHFNAKLQVCDHPSKAGCDPSCVTTTTTTTTTEKPACDCSNQPILPNGCPCDHSIRLLLPHESDCARFYECDQGERVLKECAYGNHFNAKLQICEHPSKAGCDPCIVSNKCVGCHVPHWAHETECDKFYSCSNGKEVLHTCPAGLNFNEALQTCDFTCNVSCRNRSRLFFLDFTRKRR
ncbi:chitin-binding domain protein cbd-1-like [Pieris brassicae]|uniref:chitin-binding domain protein cbd-1-like n=1 Tax=Pieris brassicae TaxID=7116 RepID=UPI001E660C3F|nr:chitin-binding domain protein cbd-1-like [Pieris brassicae]